MEHDDGHDLAALMFVAKTYDTDVRYFPSKALPSVLHYGFCSLTFAYRFSLSLKVESRTNPHACSTYGAPKSKSKFVHEGAVLSCNKML